MNSPHRNEWDQLSRPPATALKQIKGGRLSGMTDVNPQWRYKAMHDVYGPCGIGWKYEVKRTWTEPGTDGQVFQFAEICVYVRSGESWSDAIPGIGGSMLLEKDKYGLYHNDEAVKMAITDALSVALKMLGVAADIYMGRWDGSKYKDEPNEVVNSNQRKAITASGSCADDLSDEDRMHVYESVKEAVAIYRESGDIKKVDQHLRFVAGLNNDMLAAVPYFLGNAQTEDGKKLSTAWTKYTKTPKAIELAGQA